MTTRTGLRAVEWAGWAGWICKQSQDSLLPDVQRLDREDRKPPAGNCRGFFFGCKPSGRRRFRVIRTLAKLLTACNSAKSRIKRRHGSARKPLFARGGHAATR